MKRYLTILLLLIVGCEDIPDESKNKSEKKLSAKSIIANYDWCYPNCEDPTAAFKFHDKGTFNYSTTMFGGISKYGTWADIGNNKIKLLYDDNSDNILDITSNSTFQIGDTIYSKD
tara:strand:+ start:78 stop:425 length:348 start_codon:yes stop_codon:yes gene_type:complete